MAKETENDPDCWNDWQRDSDSSPAQRVDGQMIQSSHQFRDPFYINARIY